MKLSNAFKSESKLSLIITFASVFICIIVFQNCGKIILSHKIDATVASNSIDAEADDVMSTMSSAGIKDSNEFNETIDFAADMMTCGTKLDSTKVECVFSLGKLKLSTNASTAMAVKNYLSNSGIARDCPTCNDTESYTVKNISCVKNPKIPHSSSCTFVR